MTTFKRFCSSVHVTGIQNLANQSYGRVHRAFWLLMILGGTGFLVYHLHNRFDYYFSRPVMVNIDIKHPDRMPFPAVTFCNANPIRETEEYDGKATDFERRIKLYYQKKLNATEENATEVEASRLDWVEFVNTHAHQLSMLQVCWFEGEPRGKCSVTKVHTDHTICYSFNGNLTEQAHAIMPGKWNGLVLMLDTETDEYYKPATSSHIGFEVVLHEPGDVPIIWTSSFPVSPGQITYIALSRVKHINLRPPYGSCGEKLLRFYPEYSRARCEIECFTNFTLLHEECRCRYPYMPGSGPFCSFTKSKNCYKLYKREYSREMRRCSCPLDCVSDNYEKTLSFAQINPDITYKSVKKRNDSYWEKNLAVVVVNFEEMRYSVIEKRPAYSWLSLLADVGGACGLVLGGCLLTLAQMFDFLVCLVRESFVRVHKSTKRASRREQPFTSQLMPHSPE